jgi:dynamin family protein
MNCIWSNHVMLNHVIHGYKSASLADPGISVHNSTLYTMEAKDNLLRALDKFRNKIDEVLPNRREWREDIKEILRELTDAAVTGTDDDTSSFSVFEDAELQVESAVESLERLMEAKEFVLFGNAGSGKSALINALIGQNVLPSASEGTSCTQFPCSVSHADDITVNAVMYTEREWHVLKEDDLEGLLPHRPPPPSHSQTFTNVDELRVYLSALFNDYGTHVRICEVRLPLSEFMNHEVLVDLPGSNDFNSHRVRSNREIMDRATFAAVVATIDRIIDNKSVRDVFAEADAYRMQHNTNRNVTAVVATCSDANLKGWRPRDHLSSTSTVAKVRERNQHVRNELVKVLGPDVRNHCFCVSAKYHLHISGADVLSEEDGIVCSLAECADADRDWTGIDELRAAMLELSDGADEMLVDRVITHLNVALRLLLSSGSLSKNGLMPEEMREIINGLEKVGEQQREDALSKLREAFRSWAGEARSELSTCLSTGKYDTHWSRYKAAVKRAGVYRDLDMNSTVADVLLPGGGDLGRAVDEYSADAIAWGRHVGKYFHDDEDISEKLTSFENDMKQINRNARSRLEEVVVDSLGETYQNAEEQTGTGALGRMRKVMSDSVSGDTFHGTLREHFVLGLHKAVTQKAKALLSDVVFITNIGPPPKRPHRPKRRPAQRYRFDGASHQKNRIQRTVRSSPVPSRTSLRTPSLAPTRQVRSVSLLSDDEEPLLVRKRQKLSVAGPAQTFIID